MKRLPDRDWFTSHAVKAVLEISEGTLYAMIRTGEIWEPSLDERGRNVWSFEAVADSCERQIDRWLDEDVFRSLRDNPSRRCRHSREELEELREWIKAQKLKRRRLQSPAEAAEWNDTHREGVRTLELLQSMEPHNQRQRIGGMFSWLRAEGKRAARLTGLLPFGPPAPRRDED
jgi:hypothetical protein